MIDRRRLLALSAASAALAPSIARAWAIDADVRKGTIEDVQHVVILMQENRSFDHYFGTMPGVRGFGDRFPIPLPDNRTVWSQESPKEGPKLVAPFPLDTTKTFAHMRVEGTPHNWADAQYAWDQGRMSKWPEQKHPHAMGYFTEADIPFQFALANAFTLCDAYHCSFQGGTNTNRLFLWTGTNDPSGKLGGPSISNSHDRLPGPTNEGAKTPYTWTTYPERLEKAGISWRIYEDMADNFGDNPLVGFKAFRDALAKAKGSNPKLVTKGLSTQHLDALRADVTVDKLPQVSWVISPAADSEHPGPSSPAQGADYIARVLDCLTANPKVWARTVLLVNFDENDGFFDHVPPPAPPTRDAAGKLLGASTVDTKAEYHLAHHPSEAKAEREDLKGRPYGLGPRVPLYVISPWSRGGWVNSQVFDHTSCIRFLETRFGVKEPNISAWRRAVCGDLTSCFDFKTPNDGVAQMPETASVAAQAKALPGRTTPPIPGQPTAPVQASAARPSRRLGYNIRIDDPGGDGPLTLELSNEGRLGAVLHAYDLLRLEAPPRRYTLGTGGKLKDSWPKGAYDVCFYGPDGFFRRYAGSGGSRPRVRVTTDVKPSIVVAVTNLGASEGRFTLTPAPPPPGASYAAPQRQIFIAKADFNKFAEAPPDGGWYDYSLTWGGDPKARVRLAGRVDYDKAVWSDPRLGGPARMTIAEV